MSRPDWHDGAVEEAARLLTAKALSVAHAWPTREEAVAAAVQTAVADMALLSTGALTLDQFRQPQPQPQPQPEEPGLQERLDDALTQYAEREQLWHWALVKEQVSRRRADVAEARLAAVRRLVRSVDQTKSAMVMVSAVERALEAPKPSVSSPEPEPVATLAQVVALLGSWDGDALVTKQHEASLVAHLRAGWPEQAPPPDPEV